MASDDPFRDYNRSATRRRAEYLRLCRAAERAELLAHAFAEQSPEGYDSESPSSGVARPDPEDDPFACSLCGHYLGESRRVQGEDYCESCEREHGHRSGWQTCLECGHEAPGEQMEAVDISSQDEYYPSIRYLCRDCSGGDSA